MSSKKSASRAAVIEKDEKPVERVLKGEHVTFKLKEKIRENDKLYILKSVVSEDL